MRFCACPAPVSRLLGAGLGDWVERLCERVDKRAPESLVRLGAHFALQASPFDGFNLGEELRAFGLARPAGRLVPSAHAQEDPEEHAEGRQGRGHDASWPGHREAPNHDVEGGEGSLPVTASVVS